MKSRVKKRVIALMLCMVMVLSSGISTLAEGDAGTPEATEEVSSTNDESAVNTEPDTAVAEDAQSRSNTAVETETAAEENAPAEAEAQPKTAEAAPAENTETDAAAQTPVEETQTAETKDNAADAQSTEQSAENGEAVQEEATTPETENETAQNTETDPQPYEGKYEDDTIKITVNAEAGIVPEGAKLSVTPIEKTEITDDMTAEEKAEAEKINDQYDLTEKKLNEDSKENEETIEGFLAYDISFTVNGEEVEPSGDVNVVMEFKKAAIPEGVSEGADVTVKHLKEDETAEDGVVVEDMAEKAEVQTTEKAEVEKVELTADSFSVFTLAWENAAAYAYGDVTIRDNIMNDGVLKAEYSGTGTYKWLRSDEQDGNYEEVSKVYFEDGTSNISEDGSALYPALDKGARKWYKVQIVEGEVILAVSQPIQVEYFDSLQNGSFENPVIPERWGGSQINNMQYGNLEYKNAGGVWQSTGESHSNYYGKNVAIEIVREGRTGTFDKQPDTTGKSYSWYSGSNSKNPWNDAAPDGKQFAELNCQTAGALYQDVLTMEGVPLNYSLQHRARGNDISSTPEFDTMYLVIMPTEDAVNLKTQSQLSNYLHTLGIDISKKYDNKKEYKEAYKDPDKGILVVRITSDDQDWQEVTKLAGYTPTSSLTRFFFVAGRTDADEENTENPSQGNFLDAVWFSQDLPEVHEGQFSLQINKKFEGLDNESFNDIKDNIQFEISATDSNGQPVSDEKLEQLFDRTVIKGSEMYPGTDGSFYFPILGQITPDESYTVTITETNADLSGWTYTTEIKTTVQSGENDAIDSNTASFTLQEQTTATVTFTNKYEQSAKRDVNFQKVWDDENNKYYTRPESLDVTLHATANSEDITSKLGIAEDEITKTISETTGWATTWEDLPVYYTSENGEKVVITYTVTEGGIDSNYVYEAGTLQEEIPSTDASTTNAVNTMSLMQSNANEDDAESTLGAPAHKKYIEYDEQNDEYTLNLDVTGAKGEAVGGADILFVIDISNSMAYPYNSTLLSEIKDLLNGKKESWPHQGTKGIIDQIFEAGSGNEIAFVKFGTSATRDKWYSANDATSAKSYVDSLKTPYYDDKWEGGTNWTDAMEEASALMQSKANDNKEKVVIFLSDGKPTYTNDSDGDPFAYDWNGQETYDQYYDDAAKVVNQSSSLKDTTFYSVYLTDNTKSGMDKFDKLLNKNTKHSVKDGTDLEDALADIIKEVIPEYKDVTITDALSEYVEFAEFSEGEPVITVTQKGQNGTETTLPNKDYKVTTQGKKVKVELFPDSDTALKAGVTYTVSFKVKPSKKAEEEYANNKMYPNTGDPGTGDDSANQPGFYSNDEANTKVEYTVNGKEDSDDYPKPVVQIHEPQITTTSIKVKKEWNDEFDSHAPVEIVLLRSDATGETTEAERVTLGRDGENWEHQWDDLTLKEGTTEYSYTVQEVNIPENYQCSITQSVNPDTNITNVTITNTYDPNTEDLNYYIVNTLKYDTLNVQKIWDDNSNEHGKRPESVNITISDQNNSNNSHSVTLTQEDVLNNNSNMWEKTSVQVPMLKEGNYSAVEHLDEGSAYQQKGDCVISSDGKTYTFTNELKNTSVTVQKVWKDNELDKTNERPDNISFKLQYREVGSEGDTGWEVYGTETYTLTEATSWQTTIENLPAIYEYKPVEVNTPDGYISTVDGCTIINTLKWTAVKTNKPLPNKDEDAVGLDGALFELRDSNNTLIANGESGEDGTITWKKNGGEVVLDNLNGTYIIKETKTPAGYMINENGWKVEFADGVLTEFNNEPVYGDAKHGIVINLENEMLYELPEAGGTGIYWYMLGGVLLMMAGSLLVYKKRRGEVLRRK